MKRFFYILLFILSFLFYWNAGRYIENRTEAEDVFEYATMVEEGAGHRWFYHQHHLLFGPGMKLIYSGVQRVGYEGPAIHMMRLVSSLAASGTLFFFFLFCYRRFSLRPVSSMIATGFLAVTYGVWRYSAESEIPLIASVFMVAALYYATDSDARKRAFGLTILFSLLSVLMHIMNATAVFVAIPCFYLLRKRWKAAGLHLLLTVGGIAGVYSLIAQFATIHGRGGAHFMPLGLGAFVKGAVAFIQCVISCDFMLGFASVRAFLGELFAGRMLLEEFYYGARLSRGHVLFSTLTFITFVVLFVACIARASWIWKNIVTDQKRFKLPDGILALVVAGIFFFGYAGLLLFIEPGNPELWVMGLIPFSLLLCGLILLPLTYDNRLWLPFLMVLTLFIHNAEALRMLHDPEKDYQQQKSKSILDIASEDDVIMTAGNPVFERYLRYHFAGTVIYLHHLPKEQLLAGELPETAGEVYLLGDIFNQPPSLRVRFPGKTQEVDVFSSQLESSVEHIHEDEFGGIYILNRQGLKK